MDENINIEDDYYDEGVSSNPWPHALKGAMPLIVLLFGGSFVLIVLIVFLTYVFTHGDAFKASTADTVHWIYWLFGVSGALVLGFISLRLVRNAIAGWGDIGDARLKHAQARMKQAQADVAETQARVIPIGERAVAIIQLDGTIEVTPLIDEREVYQHKIVEAAKETKQIEAPYVAPPLLLPEKTLASAVMHKWDLSPEHIFLGLGKGGQELACSLEGKMHTANDAPTGAGKGSEFMMQITQLLKLGVTVLLLNPNFAPVTKKGEDWRPIAAAIERQGLIEIAPNVRLFGLVRKYEKIVRILKWLSEDEIGRRFDMHLMQSFDYKPIYAFIDEWPSIVRLFPEAAEYLVDVLQRGRAVEVNVSINAQGFLQEDIDLKGSARENFNTAVHMGGSTHSGARLLDMTVRDMNTLLKQEQVALGKGIGILRNNESVPQAQLVRLPYADNAFVYWMLGKAENWIMPELRMPRVSIDGSPEEQTTPQSITVPMNRQERGRIPEQRARVDTIVSGVVSASYPQENHIQQPEKPSDMTNGTNDLILTPAQKEKMLQVMEMDEEKKGQNEIISTIWQCDPNVRQGRAAAEELRLIRSFIAQQARKTMSR